MKILQKKKSCINEIIKEENPANKTIAASILFFEKRCLKNLNTFKEGIKKNTERGKRPATISDIPETLKLDDHVLKSSLDQAAIYQKFTIFS